MKGSIVLTTFMTLLASVGAIPQASDCTTTVPQVEPPSTNNPDQEQYAPTSDRPIDEPKSSYSSSGQSLKTSNNNPNYYSTPSSMPQPSSIFPVAVLATSVPSNVRPQLISTNIFQPVATVSPPASIKSRKDHPAPPLGVPNHLAPIGTNKFYGNFMAGSQTARTWTHPYTLAWTKGSSILNTKSWGMAISHDADRRVFGETQPSIPGNPVRFFLHAGGIQSIILSAASLGSATILTTDSITAFSVNVNLLKSPGRPPAVTFPLVQGMGFVTGIYTGTDTPLLHSNVFFKSISQVSNDPRPGVVKFRIHLNDGTNWLLYASSNNQSSIAFQLIDQTTIRATSNFNGILQIVKSISVDQETLYDAAAGTYPTGVLLSGSANNTTGSYNFAFSKAGPVASTLLMFALPHHVQSFTPTTRSAVSSLVLNTTTKGVATAVVADTWNLVEYLPVGMGFSSGNPTVVNPKRYSATAAAAMRAAATFELSQNMDAQTNLASVYGAGKALAKFAQIVYVLHSLGQDSDVATAQAGLTRLKTSFARWAENRQMFPLIYDSAWGGVVSSASYDGGSPGADYGNTFYNDHHFHYGYIVYAASIIGQLDPAWLTTNNTAYVNTLVRDYANPSTLDNWFPVYRSFDWYNGHSWAHGVTEYADGKDQESSSEDSMSAYALKMWGKTIKDSNMEARGNLQLAVTARAIQNYYLYTSTNKIQPAQFIANKAAGILFENKIDHTTYFGRNPEYIQGIHMIPLLPSSTLTRTKQFVQEEWESYFSAGRAEQVLGGWKGILFANIALADAKKSWNFFNSATFDAAWLDGGASLTWYLAFAAGLGGAP